jgi:hypothetical protein
MLSSVMGDDEIDARVEISASADIFESLSFLNPNVELVLIQLVLEYLRLVVSYAGPYLLKQLSLDEMLFFIGLQVRLYVKMLVQIFLLLLNAFVRGG